MYSQQDFLDKEDLINRLELRVWEHRQALDAAPWNDIRKANLRAAQATLRSAKRELQQMRNDAQLRLF